MTKFKWSLLGLIFFLPVLIKLPLNRFIPEQTGAALLSIIDPVTLWSGQGYFQVRGEPDVWHFDYKLCSLFSWCVELRNGTNHFESRVSPNGSGVELTQLNFVGDNQALRDIIPTDMASFDLTASADKVLIHDLACPANGVEVTNGVAKTFNINVLGNSLTDIHAKAVAANQGALTVVTSGSVEGQLIVQSTSYSGRFKAVNLPPTISALLVPQRVESGWAVSGDLFCGA